MTITLTAGNIEAACSQMFRQTNTLWCTATSTTSPTMVVAIVNNDFFMNDPFRDRFYKKLYFGQRL
jgi:hypothetical protein